MKTIAESLSIYPLIIAVMVLGGCFGCDKESWSCVGGICLKRDDHEGDFATESACWSACGISWDCTAGICVPRISGSGAFSTESECLSTCGGSDACDNPNPCNGETSISWDGHTYQLVEIGCQCWLAENLRYSGSIPEITDNTQWVNDTTGAWSYYDNDPANDTIYGKLYNWYAVNTGSLCPPGWHIPTDVEWTELTDSLGGTSVAGGKMKSTTGWNPPNFAATNESGFTGLPGGRRYNFGNHFLDIGSSGFWWSFTEDSVKGAWFRNLHTNNGSVNRSSTDKETGMSCRCIKD